jgi:hypothetical protein
MPPTDRDRAEYERNLITKIQQGWNIGRDTQVSPSLLNKAVTSAPEGSIAQQRAQQYVEAQGPSVARQVSQVQSAPQYTSLIRPSQQAVGAPSPVTPQAGPTISGAAPRAAGPTVAAPSQPNAELYQLLEQQGVYDPTSTQHQQRIAPLLAHLMTQRAGGNTSTRDGGLLSDEEQTLEDFQFLQSMLNTKDDGNFLHDFIGQNIEWIVPAAATAMLGAAGMGFGMPQGAAGAAGGGGAAVTTGAGTAAGGGGVGVGMTPALAGAGGPGAAGYVGAPAVAAAGAGAPGLGQIGIDPWLAQPTLNHPLPGVGSPGMGGHMAQTFGWTANPLPYTPAIAPAPAAAAGGLGGLPWAEIAQAGGLALGALGLAGVGSPSMPEQQPFPEIPVPEAPEIHVSMPPMPPAVSPPPPMPFIIPPPAMPSFDIGTAAETKTKMEQRKKGRKQNILTSPVGLLEEPTVRIPTLTVSG